MMNSALSFVSSFAWNMTVAAMAGSAAASPAWLADEGHQAQALQKMAALQGALPGCPLAGPSGARTLLPGLACLAVGLAQHPVQCLAQEGPRSWQTAVPLLLRVEKPRKVGLPWAGLPWAALVLAALALAALASAGLPQAGLTRLHRLHTEVD